jgi:hypothetical protein
MSITQEFRKFDCRSKEKIGSCIPALIPTKNFIDSQAANKIIYYTGWVSSQQNP